MAPAGDHRDAERAQLCTVSCLRDIHALDRPGTPRRSRLVHPHRHARPGLGSQRDLPVDPGGLAPGVALRHLPHADQRVRPGPQHQPLQAPDSRPVLLPRRLEDPLPQPPYVAFAGTPINGVPVQHALRSVHRHRRLTCPSVPAVTICSSSTAHLPTSARFRAQAPGPVSGRLYAATGGETGYAAARSRCLSAAGIRLLGILSRPGIPPLLRSAYHATISADPDRVSVFRTHETQLGWAPSIPRGRRCSHDRPEVGGRCLPLPNGQPLSPRSYRPPRGARINGTSSRVHWYSPLQPSPHLWPRDGTGALGLSLKLRTPAGKTRKRTSRAGTGLEH
jgi:hypothetical protein